MPANLTPAQRKAATSAIAAYQQYMLVLNQVQQYGGHDPKPLLNVARDQALQGAIEQANDLARRGWRSTGDISIPWIEVSKVDLTSNPKTYRVPEVILASCEDTTAIQAFDKAGVSVMPKSIPRHWLRKMVMRYYPKEGRGVDGWVATGAYNKGQPSC